MARNSIRFSDPVGYHLLQYWYSQIEAFNKDMENDINPDAIFNFFNVASDFFGRLQSHIKRNLKLAHRFAITRTKLKNLIEKVKNEDSTVMDVNNYLIDAYSKFMTAMNLK